MADATIGALRVILGADTALFDSGLKDAEKRLGNFSKSIGVAAAAISGALVAGATALGVALKRTIDEADRLGDMAEKFGVPVEELSKLKHAAEMGDVSLESLAKGLARLSRNMVETATNTGAARGAFHALGISVVNADGQLKSSVAIIEDVADRFSKMEDGAGKTALAMQLFGRSGADLIPMLNKGKQTLQEFMQEAEALGLVITQKTADSADRFNKNLERMGKIWDGILLRVTAEMVDEFEKLTAALLEFAKDPDKIRAAAEIIASGLQKMVVVAISIPVVLQNAAEAIRSTFNLIDAVASTSGQTIKEAWSEWLQVAKENAERWDGLRVTVSKFYDEMAKKQDEAAKRPAPAPLPFDPKKIEEAIRAVDNFFKEIEQENKDIMERYATPIQQLHIELEKLEAAFFRGVLSQEEFARVSEIVAQRVINAYASAAANALQTFGQVFAQFGEKNKALFQASKAFSIASAIISAYVGANKALAEYPPPLSFVMAASVVAAGLANVAKIMAQQPPAFAEGGSFRVGGVGGIDSQMVSMRLSPGEMVDVRKGEGASRATELVIPSIRPRDFFTGETVRELLLTIDEWSRDGGRGIRFAT